MKNSIRVSTTFSFKGETFSPSLVLDLDRLGSDEEIPPYHDLLAQSAGIDTYSYAFEVMQMAEVTFSEATGIAVDYLNDHAFDWKGYRDNASRLKLVNQLECIAQEVLGIDRLADHPEIEQALMSAYELGRKSH